VEQVVLDVLEGRVLAAAGVVDHAVESAVGLDGAFDYGPDLAGVGHAGFGGRTTDAGGTARDDDGSLRVRSLRGGRNQSSGPG